MRVYEPTDDDVVVDRTGSHTTTLPGPNLPEAPLFRRPADPGRPVNYLDVYRAVISGHRAVLREELGEAKNAYAEARLLVGDHVEGQHELGTAVDLNLVIGHRSALVTPNDLEDHDWPTVGLPPAGGTLLLAPVVIERQTPQRIQRYTSWDVHLLMLKHIYLDLLTAELRSMERRHDEALDLYDRVARCPYLNPHLESDYLRLKRAEVHLSHADELYAADDRPKAEEEYDKVLAEYGGDGSEPTNAMALQRIHRARQARLQITAGLNYLGYRDDYVPIWRFEYLLQQARYFAEHARQGERDFLNWREKAEVEHEKRRELRQHIVTQEHQAKQEALRVEEANRSEQVITTNISGLEERSGKLDTLELRSTEKAQVDAWVNLAVSVGSLALGIGTGWNALPALKELAGFGGGLKEGAGIVAGGFSALGALGFPVPSAVGVQTADFALRKAELTAGLATARQELEVAKTRAAIAEEGLEIARLAQQFLEENLAYLKDKALNEEYWWTLAKAIRENARRYLRIATQVAFLAEQAYEFEVERRVNTIKFDYTGRESGEVLAGDFLLGDLDLIAADAVTSARQKQLPIKLVMSLADRDPVGFSELRRTGRMWFETTLADLDEAFPGAYHARVKNVEVVVQALVGPEGIRGRLSNLGASLVRIKAPTGDLGEAYLPRDWSLDLAGYCKEHDPCPDYRVLAAFRGSETMLLSHFSPREDGALLSPPPEMLRVFEGIGAATGWELVLPRGSNTFDFTTLLDVKLVLYVTAYYDDELRDVVEYTARQQERERLRRKTLSLQGAFPDSYYHLKNPVAGAPSLAMQFDVDDGQFPYNEADRRLREVAVYFSFDQPLSEDAAVPFQLTFGAVTADLTAVTTTDGRTVPQDQRAKLFLSGLADGPLASLSDQPLEGPWELKVRADALSELELTADSIADVLLGLKYRYRLPEEEVASPR